MWLPIFLIITIFVTIIIILKTDIFRNKNSEKDCTVDKKQTGGNVETKDEKKDVDPALKYGVLILPAERFGMMDAVFTEPHKPDMCKKECLKNPWCRFFSYWNQTGFCRMNETLLYGEKTPENMLYYLYTPQFEHWVTGHIPERTST